MEVKIFRPSALLFIRLQFMATPQVAGEPASQQEQQRSSRGGAEEVRAMRLEGIHLCLNLEPLSETFGTNVWKGWNSLFSER